MASDPRRTCFIIMPFGRKTDSDGTVIDFDEVYREIFVEPVRAAGFEPLRCDEITHAGSIHRDMFTHIATDDLVIVDLTTCNPNVFYELGIRHTLKPSVTILTKSRGAAVPFNIQDQRILEYPSSNGSYAESREEIRKFLETGMASTEPDSPIFSILQDARKDWKRERINKLAEYPYRMVSQPGRQISVITGDMRQWHDIDVWVNSENTNLQMARYYDRSLSAMIRYEGAEKDDNGELVKDTIANELVELLAGRESVTPGAVYVTSSGSLAGTMGVKKIFHAATTYGVPGSGYQVIRDVEKCVTNTLRRMDDTRYHADGLGTIVFPMIGTGEGGGDVYTVAPKLIEAAISYFISNRNSRITKVYFSAWNYRDLEACQSAIRANTEIEAAPHMSILCLPCGRAVGAAGRPAHAAGEVISAGRRGRGRARAPHTWSRHLACTLPIRPPESTRRAANSSARASVPPGSRTRCALGEATRTFGLSDGPSPPLGRGLDTFRRGAARAPSQPDMRVTARILLVASRAATL